MGNRGGSFEELAVDFAFGLDDQHGCREGSVLMFDVIGNAEFGSHVPVLTDIGLSERDRKRDFFLAIANQALQRGSGVNNAGTKTAGSNAAHLKFHTLLFNFAAEAARGPCVSAEHDSECC